MLHSVQHNKSDLKHYKPGQETRQQNRTPRTGEYAGSNVIRSSWAYGADDAEPVPVT